MGKLFLHNWPNWLNWIEHQTSNLEVTGSSPVLGGNVLEWGLEWVCLLKVTQNACIAQLVRAYDC